MARQCVHGWLEGFGAPSSGPGIPVHLMPCYTRPLPTRTGREVEPGLRSTLAVALGDLALRFPNLLEGWTDRMYRPLSDPSPLVRTLAGPGLRARPGSPWLTVGCWSLPAKPLSIQSPSSAGSPPAFTPPSVQVRKNALLVLSHLILNDMMKASVLEFLVDACFLERGRGPRWCPVRQKDRVFPAFNLVNGCSVERGCAAMTDTPHPSQSPALPPRPTNRPWESVAPAFDRSRATLPVWLCVWWTTMLASPPWRSSSSTSCRGRR
jgi:hypothetical protein